MADSLKPYDPNKGFISFRLNPDAVKEEALNLIPWPVGTVAREMYRNPDGSIVETAKQVGRETPILGALLSGEYSDAAKEALLLGAPAPKARNALNKFKDNKEWYNYDQRLYYKNNKGELVDVERGFPKGDIKEARKYNDYKAALDDIDLTQDAIKEAEAINNKFESIEAQDRAFSNVDKYLADHNVNPKYEIYGVNRNSPEIMIYDPKNELVYTYNAWGYRNGKYKWNDNPSFGTKYYLQNKLAGGDIFKYDNNSRANLDMLKKQAEQERKLFNVDPRWSNETDFYDLTKDNMRNWKYDYLDQY